MLKETGRFLLIFGMILFICAPLWITISAFKNRLKYGLLCLLVPFYVYYYGVIIKDTRHTKAIKTFLIGLVTMVIGMILIS